MTLWRASLFLVAVVTLAAQLGCHATRPPPAASAPWVEDLFGSPSHLSMIARPRALASDPHWGATFRRVVERRREDGFAGEDFLLESEQVELFIAVEDSSRLMAAVAQADVGELVRFALAVHGAPKTDPLALEANGGPVFAPRGELGGGARQFGPDPRSPESNGPIELWLYEFDDGTWVLVDGRSRVNAGEHLADRAPLPMDVSDDALLAVFADAALLREPSSQTGGGNDEPWRRGIRDGGLILLGGTDGAVEIVLNYETDAAANGAETFIEDELDRVCANRKLECVVARLAVREVTISREGSAVRVRFELSAELLEALLAR